MSIVSDLPSIFSRRPDTLTRLTRSILEAPLLSRFNPAWVSWSAGVSWSGAYKALEKGVVNDERYLQVALGDHDSLEDIVIFDETHIPKDHSPASEGRHVTVEKLGHRSFRRRVVWTQLIGVMIPEGWVEEKVSSWVIPLTSDVSGLGHDKEALVATRVIQLRWLRHNGFRVLLDAGFDCYKVYHLLLEAGVLDVVVMARRAKSAVFAPRGERRHWERDKRFKASETKSEDRLEVEHPFYGKVLIDHWSKVAQDRPSVAFGDAYHIICSRLGRKVGRVEMILLSLGDTLGHLQALYLYQRRFAIEHWFRFMKGNFGLSSYRCRKLTTLKTWLYTLFSSFLILIEHKQQGEAPPWYEAKRRDLLTPRMVWQGLRRADLDPLFMKHTVKPRGVGKGCIPGTLRARAPHTPAMTRARLDTIARNAALDKELLEDLLSHFNEAVEGLAWYCKA